MKHKLTDSSSADRTAAMLKSTTDSASCGAHRCRFSLAFFMGHNNVRGKSSAWFTHYTSATILDKLVGQGHLAV